MLLNLLKDVDEQTIFDLDEEEEQEGGGGGGGAAIRTEPTSRSRRGNMWRSRASIGRRADGATGSWWRDTDGVRSVARRARFVHRRRADRIETAEERKDWIFVLDFAGRDFYDSAL